jgi:cytochrome c
MSNLELNKALGAFLFVAFVISFSSNFIDITYSSLTGVSTHGSENQEAEIATTTDSNTAAPIQAVQKTFDIPGLMKIADAENGKKIAGKCTACHSFEKDGKNKVGPNLYNIIGAKIAHMDGFNYSSAMKNHGGQWDYNSIFQWIHNPKKFIPGNRMAYGGISNEKDIADLVAYLRTMNDNPPSYENESKS